jgi:hypothetical protein
MAPTKALPRLRDSGGRGNHMTTTTVEPAVPLDAAMHADEVLQRLALRGHWLDPMQDAARERVESLAQRLGVPFDEAARRLARDPRHVHAAVRRQLDDRVLWYTLPLREVLERCTQANPAARLIDVLNLHEADSEPTLDVTELDDAFNVSSDPRARLVMDAGQPVGVRVEAPAIAAAAKPPARPPDVASSGPRGPAAAGGVRSTTSTNDVGFGRGSPPAVPASVIARGMDRIRNAFQRGQAPLGRGTPMRQPTADSPTVRSGTPPASSASPTPPATVSAWPRIDAPSFVPAKQPFEVVVGFASQQQAGVFGDAVKLPKRPHSDTLDLSIELIASGLDAPQGWSRPMRMSLSDLTAAEVRFQLVGRPPEAGLPMTLTTLEVRYVLDGTVCGAASRPLVVTGSATTPTSLPHGTAWVDQPALQTTVALEPDLQAPDLTIEILKSDRSSADGRFVCKLYSPHTLSVDTGPHDIDLGQDSKTFAKGVIEDVRQFSKSVLIENTLKSVGQLVAEKLRPTTVFEALAEVAAKVAPATPAVLIVSADRYVPWELAWLDVPLDATRPSFLGAQALVGRWSRDGGEQPKSASPAAAPTPTYTPRPCAQPLSQISVQHLAVMAGHYKGESGLARLPHAEAEAAALAVSHGGRVLAATSMALQQLIDARLDPGVQAVHFAGHGEFDPTLPDSGTLYLEDGSPLRSKLFRSANYGGTHQPLLFLNACMIGVGGELLGDMGGFPGNCLRGGFGGVLGALWEIDDDVAHQVALEFWQRALPAAPGKPEPVAAVLRDLRAKYASAATTADGSKALPSHTYLAYVFYGHPRLTLARAV